MTRRPQPSVRDCTQAATSIFDAAHLHRFANISRRDAEQVVDALVQLLWREQLSLAPWPCPSEPSGAELWCPTDFAGTMLLHSLTCESPLQHLGYHQELPGESVDHENTMNIQWRTDGFCVGIVPHLMSKSRDLKVTHRCAPDRSGFVGQYSYLPLPSLATICMNCLGIWLEHHHGAAHLTRSQQSAIELLVEVLPRWSSFTIQTSVLFKRATLDEFADRPMPTRSIR